MKILNFWKSKSINKWFGNLPAKDRESLLGDLHSLRRTLTKGDPNYTSYVTLYELIDRLEDVHSEAKSLL